MLLTFLLMKVSSKNSVINSVVNYFNNIDFAIYTYFPVDRNILLLLYFLHFTHGA